MICGLATKKETFEECTEEARVTLGSEAQDWQGSMTFISKPTNIADHLFNLALRLQQAKTRGPNHPRARYRTARDHPTHQSS